MKQYRFSLIGECMKEEPLMEEPVISDYSISFGREHSSDIEQYDKHIASLQSIPIHEQFINFFLDGNIYNEDDFYLSKNAGKVIPKIKEEDEDDLWNELADIFYDDSLISQEQINKAKKLFTITRNNLL